VLWLRTDYEPPSAPVVVLMVTIGVGLIIFDYVSLGVFTLVAFASLSLYNWHKRR